MFESFALWTRSPNHLVWGVSFVLFGLLAAMMIFDWLTSIINRRRARRYPDPMLAYRLQPGLSEEGDQDPANEDSDNPLAREIDPALGLRRPPDNASRRHHYRPLPKIGKAWTRDASVNRIGHLLRRY